MSKVSWWNWVTAKLRGRGVAGAGRAELGARGEAHAARYLKGAGYRIIARNRRHLEGEIDLIAMDGEHLIFVEVRTRTSEDFMTPEASIRKEKREAVRRTVKRLIRKHKTAGLVPRVDLVAIVWPEGAKEPSEVRHHRGVIAVGGFGR
jgi:putative endonuclease